MKRLVLEADVEEFSRVSGDKVVEKIKFFEILHFIRQDKDEIVIIASLEFKDSSTKLDVFDEPGSELQVLDRSREGRYTILFKTKPQNDPAGEVLATRFWNSGGYMLTPLEIKNGKIKMSFLGNAKQLRVIPSLLKSAGIHYRVVQITDANLLPSSPLSSLTEKQRRVLTTAYNSGYYDVPRKIDSKQLASKLNIGSSDLIKHRRKAERRLLAAILSTA